MKFLIFDSGPLISLSISGLLHTLEQIKRKFPNIIFVITPSVKKEVIDKSLSIKRYELNAIKLQSLIESGVLSMSSKYVSDGALSREIVRIKNLSSNILKADGKFLEIIHEGEISCLAFSSLCGEDNLIVIDERITRLISESPNNLKIIMERKIHMPVSINRKNLKAFENFRFIRSCELVYFAHINDMYGYKKNRTTLDALLYSLKYAGASISSKEIEEMKRL